MGRNAGLHSNRLFVSLLASTALSGVTPAIAQSLPTGYSTAYGSVGFQRSSGSLTINQSSQNAIVNYNSFSVGRGNSVTFNQPNSRSAILNRVTGNTTSTIAGRISANGQVYLVNPNGIAITKTGVVKVGGGFTASSLGMTDEEFRHARKHFKGGGSSAMVSNAGTIRIGRGGYAALIGGQVRNSGLIEVPMGKVGLGSGEAATLDVSGDGFLQVAMPTRAGGKTVLIQQSGTISSAGGMVILDAATARAAARNAVNISGTIDAHSISGHSGSIQIGGGYGGTVQMSGRLNVSGSRHFAGGSVAISGHRVRVSGTIEASGRVGGKVTLAAANGMTITGTIKAIGHHGKGGTVTVTGLHIALQGAKIDASGTTGGGTVLIGGNAHGAGPLANAGTVTIDAKSTITADAIGSGNGGSVVVWSDLSTRFAGMISAQGGPNGGNGGSVEVSSHGLLAYTGTTNLLALAGTTGTLLLDPYNVVISTGTDSGYTATAASGTTSDTPSGTSVINATTLDSQLATANVTITPGTSGGDAGNITVAAPLTWSSGSLLTLTAANAIAINAPITIAGAGQLALNDSTSSPANLSFAQGESVSYAVGIGSGIAGQALTINGTSYTLIYSLTGSGASALNQIDTTGDSGHYALATSLIGTGSAGSPQFTSALAGAGSHTFSGTFNGLGNTISNLTMSTSATYVGLFGQSSGTIANVGLVGGSVSGDLAVGGLVGYQIGGSIMSSYATNAVVGNSTSANVGGLVGESNGVITSSYAAGAVSGYQDIGGLVGRQIGGTITSSYATGAVSGTNVIGGLVGYQPGGSITSSYATGAVSGGDYLGGLIGEQNGGSITSSFYDMLTTGRRQAVGVSFSGAQSGVTGVTTAGLASATVLTALNTAAGGTVWANVNNQTTPYLVSNPGPVYLGTDTSATPAAFNLVFNVSQLQAINNSLSGNYALAQNIDATGYSGFTPIGESTAYSGTFNGFGNTISNLTISSAGDAGLFGQLGLGGTIANVGLVGGSVSGTGDASISAYTGGLVGYQSGGTIISSYATGAVSGTGIDRGMTYTGGLVGYQGGGTIISSYATGAVSGAGTASRYTYSGGLVGDQGGGTIVSSYATGAVYGRGAGGSSIFSGGLVGEQSGGMIVSSYATGAASGTASNVTSLSRTGGLVGDQSGGTIVSSYATGAVSGTASGSDESNVHTGGLVGVTGGGTIASSYWDTTTSGQATGVGVGGAQSGVTGVTTAGLASATVLTALNTAAGGTVWANVNNQTTPYLVSNPGPVYLGTDTSATPAAYSLVFNVSQLQAINNSLSGNYALAQNIDATGYSGFTPIGESTAYSGTFDGLGNTISNLTISTGASYAGLFGQSGGTIENVGLVGGSVTGTVNANVGGLVGTQTGGSIVSSFITGSVSGFSNDVGGLVGTQNGGSIVSSYATGAVSNGSDVGGLVGAQNGGSIVSSYATGAVSNGNIAGGLVGYQGNTSITSSYATGAVLGTRLVGGLVGNQNGSIASSYATGSLSGGNADGGLVGEQDGGSTTSSYATGTVPGTTYGGGLVGDLRNGTITSSYATGAVSRGGVYGGGLVGYQEGGTITSSYATGAVLGIGNDGGLVGRKIGGSIASSYYDASTTGQSLGTQSNGSMGLSTSQLQGTLPSGFSSAVWGTGTGLYPYLTAFYATTPQAISGTAYSDHGITPLASNGGGLQYAFVDVGGAQAAATTGTNGYYYILEPAGTLAPAGTATLAYTTATNTAAGTITGASLLQATGTTQHLDIWGNTLIAPTTATTLSGAPTTGAALYGSNNNAALATSAVGTNPTTGLGTLASAGYIATGSAGFTVDTAVASGAASGGLYVQTTQGPINVTAAQTLTGPTDLSLLSGGALAFDAPVTVNGAGVVNLAYNTSSATNLSFAQGDGLQFTGTPGSGQALTINGQGYTLLYSLANANSTGPDTGTTDVAGIDANTAAGGDAGHYALATSLTGTGTAVSPQFTAALAGAGANTFSGTFEGLGNTITNLTIGAGSSSVMVGLFGTSTSQSTIRDIGLIGGSVSGYKYVGALVGFSQGPVTGSYATGAVSGSVNVGGLIGDNTGAVLMSYATGAVSGTSSVGGLIGVSLQNTVRDSYATGAVSGTSAVGGLIGFNEGQSLILTSYATGTVSGSPQSNDVGGLVGFNDAAIQMSHASGAVSALGAMYVGGLAGANTGSIQTSYATGAVSALGSTYVGGLAGNNTSTVQTSYATGAVSGTSNVGGLIGFNASSNSLILTSYATGAVSGLVSGLSQSTNVGGLVGLNSGTIQTSYFDMQTTGQSLGIGLQFGTGTAIGLTTAQLQGTAGLPNGLTNPILGANSGFSGGAAGGAVGLYPYLTSFYPTAPQAVSGIAYKDAGATPLASGANGVVAVSVIGNGASLGAATTGANGYYYVLVPAGSLASGQSVLAYTSVNTATGAQNAATLTNATGATAQTGVNIYGNALTVPTSATSLSMAPTLAQAQTSALAADGGNAAAAAAINGAAGQGFIASGASFTIDQPVTTANTLVVQTAANAPITVAAGDPITIQSGGSLGLLSAGSLAIDAPVTVNGAGSVALAAAYDTTTDAGGSLLELSFGNGASLTYTDASGGSLVGTSGAGGALAINGQAYTLLYSLAAGTTGLPDSGSRDIAGIDLNAAAGGDGGHYALATNVAGTGTTFTSALVGENTYFTGTLDGLGNTITNLTISTSATYAGLFGQSKGTIRDIGLVGAFVSGTTDVGALVGKQTGVYQLGGTITQSYATGAVSGGDSSQEVGGLVGYNFNGAIAQSYATVAVSAGKNSGDVGGLAGGQLGLIGTIIQSYATGTVSAGKNSGGVGGLIGSLNSGTITQSYATGAVSGGDGSSELGGLVGFLLGSTITRSYATGAVTGGDSSSAVGGLAGALEGSTITQAYATGAVSGGNSSSYVGGLAGSSQGSTITQSYATGAVSTGMNSQGLGGLVGYQDGSTIAQSYATGAVSPGIGATSVGGLVGSKTGGSINASYYDISTTGQSVGIGGGGAQTNVTGETTRQLQGLDSGFSVSSLGSAFSGGANGLYPYLTSFYATTPQAISGIAYSDRGITPLASNASGAQTVFVDVAGAQISATTGANGYYYVLEPTGALAAPGTATLAYTTQDSTSAGTVSGATLMKATGSVQDLDIWGSTLIAPTTATSLSGATAAGLTTGTGLYTSNGNAALAGLAKGTNTTTGLGTLADAGYIATGIAGFTVNAPVASGASAGGLYVQTTQGSITVATAETLNGPTNLSLYSAGALTVDATVTVNGAGSVNLAGTSQPGLTTTGLSFANGASIDYGASNQGGTFALNGSSYTLLYAASDLSTVNTNLAGNYALATNLDASGLTGLTTGLIAGGGLPGSTAPTPFSGNLDGLGHSISSLTINGGLHSYVGLIGASTGTVSNLDLVGGAVSGQFEVGALVGDNEGVVQTSAASVTVSGNADPLSQFFDYAAGLGGLVGENSGTIQSSHATGAVIGGSGGGDSHDVGGLVGSSSGSNSVVQTSYATGAVSGGSEVGGLIGALSDGTTVETSYATGAVSATGDYIGGLIGTSQNSLIQMSYATGAVSGASNVGGLAGDIEGATTLSEVTNSYATGAVSGGSAVGGLVGYMTGYAGGAATVANSYATGAVRGGNLIGGLVGEIGLASGTDLITHSYATGAVAGSSAVGGVLGGTVVSQSGTSTITDAYYDADTTGQALGLQSDGSVGLSTAALQSTGTTSVSLGTAFAGGAAGGENNVYPYLTYFDPHGVQAVSGFAYTDGGATLLESPASGLLGNGLPTSQRPGYVSAAANGDALGTVTTGANGYYYIVVPAGTLPATTRTAAYTVADTGTNGSGATNAATYVTASGGNTLSSTDIYGGWQFDAAGSSFTTLSSLNTADVAAASGLAPTGVVNREIVTSASSFAVNAVTSLAGTLVLDASGSVTQNAGVTANALLLEGGGSFTLTGSNTITTLAATGGTIDVDTTGAVTVGSVSDATGASDAGIDATGSVTLISGGAQTLAAHGTITSGGAILLAGKGIFTNAAGANALTPGHAASFTIYSQDPTHPTTVLPADVFGGLTATNYYNDAYNFSTGTFASVVPTGNHFVYGYAATLTPLLSGSASKIYNTTNVASLTNLTIGATLLSGNDAATFSITGAIYDTANAGSNKTVTATGITFDTNPNNYVLGSLSASAAIGSIGKATITVAGATGIDKTYDTTTALLNGASGFTDTGVLGHDQVSVTAGSDTYAGANAGHEAINVSGLRLSGAASGNYQLSSTSVTGSGTIGRATITVVGSTGIDKTYDTTTALTNGAVGFTDTGVLGHDQVTVTAGSDAYASANAGGEAINVSGLTLSGSAAGNYQLSSTSVTGAGTIGKATITVAGATGIDKTYDTTTALTNGAVGFTDNGVLGHDQVTVTAGSDAYAGASAGHETINVSGLTLSGSAANNYQLSSTAVTGSGTIGKATITVAGATGIDKTYDTTTALLNGASGFTDTGVLGHDQITVTAGSDAYASANAGHEAINVSGLTVSGGAAANYQLSSTSVTGSGTIGKATITVAGATGIDKTYDTTTGLANGASGFTDTDTGVLGRDQVTVTAGSDAYASANAGHEAINVSGLTLSGGAAGNYQLSSTSVTGSGTIGKATITVAGATGIDKTYDTTNALTNGAVGFTDSGVLGQDQVTITAGSDAYASANAGHQAINVSGLTLSGSAAGNYQLSSTSVTGAGTIGKAIVIVTALGGTSIYGDTPINPGLSATGLQGGQTISVLTGLSNSFGIDGRTSVGAYAVSVMGTLTNANYVVGATRSGVFDVTPRALTITADNETRAQGFANPPLAYQIGGLGLVNGDHVVGALFTPATIASPIGHYAIDQGTLSVTSNYSVTYVPGMLSVGAAADQSAGTLGSTVDRGLLQSFGHPGDGLPFISSPAGEGTSAPEIIHDLGDPHFDEAIACVKDICTIVVTRKPIKTTSLEPRP